MTASIALSDMTEVEAKQFIKQHLRESLRLEQDDCNHYASKLYDYYKRLNSFPQSTSTLVVSMKVLVKSWGSVNKNADQAPTSALSQKTNIGAGSFQAMNFKRG